MTLRINLSGSDTATCSDLTVKSAKSPICSMARKLIKSGVDGSTAVLVYRGETICFKPATVSEWADRSVSEPDAGSPKFSKYQPMPENLRAAR